MNCPPTTSATRPSFPSLYNPLLERYRDCDQPNPSVTHLEHARDIFRFTLYWTLILYLPLFALPAFWGLFVHFIPHRISRRKQNAQNTKSGGGIAGDRPVYSPLALERPSNANALSPRSSEPFLLDSPRALTAIDRSKPADKRQPYYRRATFGSWTPSRTLQTLRKRQTDSSYPMESTTPASPMSEMPNYSLPRVPTMTTTMGMGTRTAPTRTLRHSSLRNRSGGITCLILAIPLAFLIIGAIVGVVGSLVIGYLLAALKDAAGVRISTWLPLGWAIIQVHTVLLGMFTNMISFI